LGGLLPPERRAERSSAIEQLRKIEREFRVERRRDYFRSPLRGEAAAALKTTRETVRGSEAPDEVPGAGGEG
jgi:hypothetical protein